MPNTFASILKEVECEADRTVRADSAEVESAAADLADTISDGLATADSIQAGVETVDYSYTVPDEAPEPDPPQQLSNNRKRKRTRCQPDLQQVLLAKNSNIKVCNLSLKEAINKRGAEVAKNAAFNELYI